MDRHGPEEGRRAWSALDGGASLVGFDVRPADGKLYGVTPDGAIVTVDVKTGKWEKKSQLSEKLPEGATLLGRLQSGGRPAARLSSDGMSLRINVEDGKATVDGSLKYAEADANKGKQPKVTAAAYSNSFAGTKETALYDIDAANGTLVKQAPPNDGILNTIGKLGMKLDGPVAFDIWSDGKGGNTGWLLAGNKLYSGRHRHRRGQGRRLASRASRARSAISPSCRRCSRCGARGEAFAGRPRPLRAPAGGCLPRVTFFPGRSGSRAARSANGGHAPIACRQRRCRPIR